MQEDIGNGIFSSREHHKIVEEWMWQLMYWCWQVNPDERLTMTEVFGCLQKRMVDRPSQEPLMFA
ncbi:hypothetical protein FRC03_010655 [Tulasnella sp. 419]|nr:hypothetical protein FRC03_010655 [Tulasnella sp. 419]